MHERIFEIAAFWLMGLIIVCVVQAIRARTLLTRILAIDVVTLMVTAFLILYADSRRAQFYLDAALVVALLSFVATIAAARYTGEGKLFR